MSEQKTVSRGDVQRRTANEQLEQQLELEREGKAPQSTENKANEDQEVVLANEVTSKILGSHGVKTVTQEELDKREQSTTEGDNPAIERLQQATPTDEGNVDITEADIEILEKAGIPESDLEGKTIEEIKGMANDLRAPQEPVSQEPEKIIISDAYADQLSAKYPFAKNLRGKTMDDVMDILQNQNSYITQLEQQKSTVKPDKANDETNSQNTETNDQLTQEEVIDLMTLSPKEATAKLNKMIKNSTSKEVSKAVEEKFKEYIPDVEALQNSAIQNAENMFFSKLQEALPKDADARAVFADWKKDNSHLTAEEKATLVKNGRLLVDTVSKDFKLKSLSKENSEIKNTTNQTIKKNTYDNLRKLLKQSHGSGAKFNLPRGKANPNDLDSDEGDPAERMIGSIISKELSNR